MNTEKLMFKIIDQKHDLGMENIRLKSLLYHIKSQVEMTISHPDRSEETIEYISELIDKEEL